jgi:hypothetical protein
MIEVIITIGTMTTIISSHHAFSNEKEEGKVNSWICMKC